MSDIGKMATLLYTTYSSLFEVVFMYVDVCKWEIKRRLRES